MKIIILFFIFSSQFLIFSTVHSQSSLEYYRQAKQAKSQFKYSKAANLISKAIKLDSNNVDYWMERGDIFLGLEKEKKAKADFDMAVTIVDDPFKPLLKRSEYYIVTGSPDSALTDSETAYEMATDNIKKAKALTSISIAQKELGNNEVAIDHLRESLKLDSTNVSGMEAMAAALVEEERFKEAIYYLEESLKFNRGNVGNYINLGFICMEAGLFREAVEYFNMALFIDPNQPLALNNRGYTFYLMKEYDLALEDIEKSLRNDKQNAHAYKNKGLVLIARTKSEEACTEFKKALKFTRDKELKKSVENLMAETCE